MRDYLFLFSFGIDNNKMSIKSGVKREEFRKYLEKSGVIQSLTKSLIKLIQMGQKPENPIDFIKENLGESLLSSDYVRELEKELKEAQEEICRLQSIIDENSKKQIEEKVVEPTNNSEQQEPILSEEVIIEPITSTPLDPEKNEISNIPSEVAEIK